MDGYGYSYQNYSAESNGSRRPFVPFVPNSNRDSEGYGTRKTVVPVATRQYGDDYYNTHGSPTKGYSIRDDDYLQKQKVDDFLIHVHNEGSRSSALGSPVRNGNYYRQGGGGGYGNYDTYNDNPRRSPNDGYDRYYHQPADTYSSFEPHRNTANGWSRPASGWTPPPPRNGTQLSEPTSDIGKALGLLKEAAKVSSSPTGYGDSRGRPKDETYYGSDRSKPSIWADPPGNGGAYPHREPTKVDKAMELAREAERLRSLKNKLLGEPKPTNHMNNWQAQKKYNGASF